MRSFAASVGKWASASEARITAVYRRSVEMLADEMTKTKAEGGRVPFLTGNLYRSLRASKTEMPPMGEIPFESQDIGIVTARLQPSEPVWLGYQANYARRMNSGYIGADSLGRVYNQQGHYFVEGAIAEWPQIVSKAAKEMQTKVGGQG